MNWFQMQFTAGEAAEICEMTRNRIHGLLRRPHFENRPINKPISGGGAQGKKDLRLSIFGLSEFFVAKHMMDDMGLAVSPDQALRHAASFAHVGHDKLGTLPKREPSLPFHHSFGQTVMVVGKGTHFTLFDGKRDVFKEAKFFERDGFALLPMSSLFEKLCRRIGVEHRSVLDASYTVKDS